MWIRASYKLFSNYSFLFNEPLWFPDISPLSVSCDTSHIVVLLILAALQVLNGRTIDYEWFQLHQGTVRWSYYLSYETQWAAEDSLQWTFFRLSLFHWHDVTWFNWLVTVSTSACVGLILHTLLLFSVMCTDSVIVRVSCVCTGLRQLCFWITAKE